MTPRPYRQRQRQTTTDRTEARILKAARDLLFSPKAGTVFSLEGVAKRARVTRRTIYLRFGSRRALIEAAFDAMAEKNGMRKIGHAFQQEDPMEALMAAVTFFCRFYEQGRAGMRRVRAHAEFDPELAEAIRERNERRRAVLRTLIQRLAARTGNPAPERMEDAVGLVFSVTGFEVFDSIAGTSPITNAVTGRMQRLAVAILTPPA